MTAPVSFDQYKNIDYRSISRLFWNEYPYKVLIHEELARPASLDCAWGTPTWDLRLYKQWVDFRARRNEFYRARRGTCPEDTTSWKSINNGGHTFSFFFKEAGDAKNFITKNRRHIVTVFRPENQSQIDALGKDRKLVLRDTLFWDRYRYCIEFHDQPTAAADQVIDDRIAEMFGNRKDKRRYFYTFSRRRRLYLRRESDIFHVKMALYEHIRSQTEALLKKDISK